MYNIKFTLPNINVENHNNLREMYILALKETNSRGETICKLFDTQSWDFNEVSVLRRNKSEVYYKILNCV